MTQHHGRRVSRSSASMPSSHWNRWDISDNSPLREKNKFSLIENKKKEKKESDFTHRKCSGVVSESETGASEGSG